VSRESKICCFMKRNIPLYIVLVILLLAALYFFFSRGAGSIGKFRKQFSVADTSKVQMVEITAGDDSVFLHRHDGRWLVNGKYYARDRQVANLLYALLKLQPDAPVSRKNREDMPGKLQDHSRKVTITMEGKKDKIFYAWYDSLNRGHLYMVSEGSDHPFRMQVPGMDPPGVNALFSANGSAWRDNLLFSIPAGRIKKTEVNYSGRPDASFRIEKDEQGEWLLAGTAGNKVMSYSRAKLTDFLYQLGATRFDEILPLKEVVLPPEGLGEPMAVISVTDADDIVTVVHSYQRLIREDGGSWVVDFNRLYLRVNDDEEILLARYIKLDLVLKEITWFSPGEY